MTSFQGWIIIAELALLIIVLLGKSPQAMGRKQNFIEIEITRVGDGFVHGKDRCGQFYAVDGSRVVGNPYPKVGDTVWFS
jgi:hypothetical protein